MTDVLPRVPNISISAEPPPSPTTGDLWWSPVTGQKYIYWNDGNTLQWVVTNFGVGRQVVGDDILGTTGSGYVVLQDSPVLTGNPTAPTPPQTDDDTSIATTQFVHGMVAGKSFANYGAKGNGTTDDTIAVKAAIASKQRLNGHGLTYAVSDDIELGDKFWIEDAKFVQLNPVGGEIDGSGKYGRRTLKCTLVPTGGTLKRVKVDRGGGPFDNLNMDATGIRLTGKANGSAKFYLEDCEVTGGGIGRGIDIVNAYQVTMIRPHVHDMFWYQAVDPSSGGEQLSGITCTRCLYVRIDHPQVHRLMGWFDTAGPQAPDKIFNKVLRAYQSDGMGISGAEFARVDDAHVSWVGEGYDGSGNHVSHNVWFYGPIYEDCAAGWKAMAHRDSGVRGGQFIRCGLAAVAVASSPSTQEIVSVKNYQFSNCYSVDCGASHEWVAAKRPFWIESSISGAPPLELPPLITNVRCDSCTALAHVGVANGWIAGDRLETSTVINGDIVKGQNLVGADGAVVADGTFIIGRGRVAAVIARIHGHNNLTLSAPPTYGTVVIGQKVFGPLVREGLTIISGSGLEWVLSNNPNTESHLDTPNVAMLLDYQEPETSYGTASISGDVLHVTALRAGYPPLKVGHAVSDYGNVEAGTVITAVLTTDTGAGDIATYQLNKTQPDVASSDTFEFSTAIFTIYNPGGTPQTVGTPAAQAKIVATSNMDFGWLSSLNLADNLTLNDCVVVGQTQEPFHNVYKRVSGWLDTTDEYMVLGKDADELASELPTGGVRVPTTLVPANGPLGAPYYITRRASYRAQVAEIQYDRNYVHEFAKLRNYGIANVGQGGALAFYFGSHNNPFNAGFAGSYDVISDGTWLPEAVGTIVPPNPELTNLSNRKTRLRGRIADADVKYSAFEATKEEFSVPGVFRSMTDAAIGPGSLAQAFFKAGSGDFGWFYGTGAPAFVAGQGSMYTQTNASTTTTRIWVRTASAWAFVTTST